MESMSRMRNKPKFKATIENERKYIQENEAFFTEIQSLHPTFLGKVGRIGLNEDLRIKIILPEYYPYTKPKIFVINKIEDSKVSDENELLLDICKVWEPYYRLKDVIFEARRYFNVTRKERINEVPLQATASQNEVNTNFQLLENKIISFQDKIKEIEKNNLNLQKQQIKLTGIPLQSVLEAPPEAKIRAQIHAIDDLDVLLTNMDDNGLITQGDYFKQVLFYNKLKYKLRESLETNNHQELNSTMIASMVKSEKKNEKVDFEAELYATIITIDTLAKKFERGMANEEQYKKQLQNAIARIFKAQTGLEGLGGNIEEFLSRHKIDTRFPEGAKRLRIIEGEEKEELLTVSKLKGLLGKTEEFTSSAITLSDILKLKTVARVELIFPHLDIMLRILDNFPNFGDAHWVPVQVNSWRKKLQHKPPNKLLSNVEIEQMGFDCSRWLAEFKAQLKFL